MKLWIKKLLHQPIYRVDVLNYVKRKAQRRWWDCCGLCFAIDQGLKAADVCSHHWRRDTVFPLFDRYYARAFGAERYHPYWWPIGEWSEEDGRMRFLNWLIEQYKDDKTDLRKTGLIPSKSVS